MAGFLGIGGVNSKQQNQSVNALNNLYNFGLNTAKGGLATGGATQGAGVAGLGDANSYFKSLATGNRAAMQQAQAPAINASLSASDAAKRQAGTMGTARGGGVAGTNQTRADTTQAGIDNALFAARPTAAAGEAQTSGKIADVGSQEMEQALQALGISSSSTSAAGQIATNARSQAGSEQQAIIGDIFGFGSGFKTGTL